MKNAVLSAVAVVGLLLADGSAKAQVYVGVRPGIGINVNVGGGFYLPPPPPPIYYPPPPPAYAPQGVYVGVAPYAPPAVVISTPSVFVSVPLLRPAYYGYGGYYRPYYHHRR